VAAARGLASGEIATVRQVAEADVTAARHAAEAEVAAARQAAEADVTAARQAAQADMAAARQAAEGTVAEARRAAEAEVAAARQAAQAEIENVRRAAQAEIDTARTYAEDVARHAQSEIESARTYAEEAARQAQSEVARVMATTPVTRTVTIPIAPVQVRGQIKRIEEVLDALYQIDYVLEIGVTTQPPPDIDFVRTLTATVRDRVKGLSDEFANLPARLTDPTQAEAATTYANAAGAAYHALLQRIEDAVQRLGSRTPGPAAGIIEPVVAMLADPSIQALR
jgi:hypothetical protein